MAKKLVVVESPAKARTINKILGKDFVVESSMGHVRDLPVRTLGVDVDNGFMPKYALIKGRRKVVDKLKKAAAGCDAIYLAPDPDREGEAIAWHLAEILKGGKEPVPFHRVQYNEITPTAVRHAFEHPGSIEMNRVDAQQARRILDRIVGYMVSPILWRRIRRGLSAGRVQSVALRLVCEREREILKFEPEVFWVHGARVRKLVVPLDPFRIKLHRIDGEKPDIKSEETSQGILQELEGRSLKVTTISSKEISKRPPPPYITSSLQQAGSSYCGFSPKRTMSLAQSLYEGVDLGQGPVGLITYMRTDSVQLAQDAVNACRAFVTKEFGDTFCPEKPNRYRSRAGAQEAHEAIRPTDVNRTPDQLKSRLDPAAHKLYTLIWRRFVACQMAAARLKQRTVEIEALKPDDGAREFLFQGTSSDIIFPGYMKVTGADRRKAERDGEEEERLPDLREGEPLTCVEWLAERKETQPPPRYSETSLVGALERNGVGRPSTYAQIISTLHDRQYVERENKSLRPTDLGLQVNDLLVETLGELFNVSFTAGLESELDRIERGELNWTGMLDEFYARFKVWLEKTKAPPAPAEHVARVLEVLEAVTEWMPPVKRGRRTYSDERFAASIREQAAGEGGETSQRQFEALIRIACKYRDQLPDVERTLADMGYAESIEQARKSEPRETTLRKLSLLEGVELDESGRDFVTSLQQRTAVGRGLSEAQLRVLNSILVAAGDQIEAFESIAGELELDTEAAPQDEVSGALLEALDPVTEWKPPVKRGKRTFDDKAFHQSLKDHFSRKGFLSERQQAALKRLVYRYREQVANFDELAGTHGLGPKQKK